MKFALVNPPWSFDGSIYFGCREPHLPLEYGYARALLREAGHEAEIFDAQLAALSLDALVASVADYAPDAAVITTAPSYLFWRCAPPELRVPQQTADRLRPLCPTLIVVGPHASTTPQTTLGKMGADATVIGECEDILPMLAAGRGDWSRIPSLCHPDDGDGVLVRGPRHASDMTAMPALRWENSFVRAHAHHHHRFDAAPSGPGAEMETSRGCPYRCTFCAKDNFRNAYRRRPLDVVEAELNGLVAQGVEYVYFIDEIFLPNRDLLALLARTPVRFGVQTRIDLWSMEMIERLGDAGCVSIEAGIESISAEGRNLLDKNSRLSTDQMTERLLRARERVPFVQGNLIDARVDDMEAVERWRQHLIQHGVWANMPVPLFPYPGSPDYTRRWGEPDDRAWERALDYYLDHHVTFSDIQDDRPLRLDQLERPPSHGRAGSRA